MVEKVEIQAAETNSEKPVETQEQTNETQSTQSKPEGLPEKFNSVEELAKSYAELEKKLGGQSQKEEVDPIGKTTLKEQEANKNTLEVAEKAVESAGLDMTSLQNEYAEKGELDAKSYEALAKVGITKEYVDNYISGQQALAEKYSTDIKNTVGGDTAYKEMVEWAAENMTDGEKQAYNKAVNSSDMETVKLAVNALKGQYERANGTEPKLMSGKATPSVEQGFQSWAQVTEAMSNPKYAKDIAYQNEVKQKLQNSNL